MRNIPSLMVCLAALVPASTASAHVVLTQPTANAGRYHAAFFRMGHGCQGQATTALSITLPAQTPRVRAQAKPGWTIETATDPQGASVITWHGYLSDDQFDDFGLMMCLPDQAQDLAYAITQTCGDTTVVWDGRSPSFPQPVLRVLQTRETSSVPASIGEDR